MLTRILAPILCALLAVASACDQQSDPVVVAPALNAASSWYEIVAAEPDPAVVTDAEARARMTATKLPWKVRDRKTGIVMLLCPPGEFTMGSPASEAGRSEDEAQHPVTITKAFYLSETEVTQEVWQKVVGANPSKFQLANNPVEQVSWNDCQSFCLSSGLRLASESEWEYACRAGTTGLYAGDPAAMAWFGDNSGKSTRPVKQRKPNAWGLYDMHGNVWEWCQDGYAQSASSTQQASTGNIGARVLRGGGWAYYASSCRCATRYGRAPGSTNNGYGFRVARTSDDQQSVPVVVAPVAAPAALSAPTPPKPAASQLALDWCDVVAAEPDPAVVTDAAARGRMTATKLPWKVRDRKTGIVMLLCPPGEFMMGSQELEGRLRGNEEQHSVTITKAFYLSETEVTQEVWQKVTGANPSRFSGPNNPVDVVSWNDCQKFCQSSGLRLATESEWEYACRAGTTGAYAGDLASMAWFDQNSGFSPHPVKQRKPNAWGLYDMHGNVWELCEDGYAKSASSTQQASTLNDEARVLRGGGCMDFASACRSAFRDYLGPGLRSPFFGFRVARALESAKPEAPGSTTTTTAAPRPSAPASTVRWNTNWDAEIVRQDPDPAVVTDAEARARMTATKLPWKVRDLMTGIVMLLCPPGEFMMGSPASEAGREANEAQHSVTITKAFYLSETEVTQESWQKVVGENPSEFQLANNPVEQVSWNDCQSFCLSSGLRLASESEWEYACRAGTTGAYSFGASINQQQANFEPRGTVACGSLPANQWGFREMHGNVWEWCEDRYQATASSTQEAVNGNSSSYRVLRGGSWGINSRFGRSSGRYYGAPVGTFDDSGFRVARTSE